MYVDDIYFMNWDLGTEISFKSGYLSKHAILSNVICFIAMKEINKCFIKIVSNFCKGSLSENFEHYSKLQFEIEK